MEDVQDRLNRRRGEEGVDQHGWRTSVHLVICVIWSSVRSSVVGRGQAAGERAALVAGSVGQGHQVNAMGTERPTAQEPPSRQTEGRPEAVHSEGLHGVVGAAGVVATGRHPARSGALIGPEQEQRCPPGPRPADRGGEHLGGRCCGWCGGDVAVVIGRQPSRLGRPGAGLWPRRPGRLPVAPRRSRG